MEEIRSSVTSVTEFFALRAGIVFSVLLFGYKSRMAKKKDEYLVIPVEEKEMEEKGSPTDAPNQAEDELEEKFDKAFWLKVL